MNATQMHAQYYINSLVLTIHSLVPTVVMMRLKPILNVEERGKHDSRANIHSTVVDKSALSHRHQITSSTTKCLEKQEDTKLMPWFTIRRYVIRSTLVNTVLML